MKTSIRMLGAATLFALAGNAMADAYVGGGLYSLALDVAAGGDDKSTAPAVFVGWRPIELVGVEAGYYDLGSYTIAGTDIDASALTLAGLLSFELGPVGVYVKGGMADATLKIEGMKDQTNTDPFGGLGVSFDALDKLYVYGEVLRFSDDDADIDVVGVGVRYAF